MSKGRNPLYSEWITEDGLLQITSWAREGLSDKEIAQQIGVTPRTFSEWKYRFPSISSSIKKARAPMKEKGLQGFFSRTCWQTVTETKKEYITDKEGNITGNSIKVVETTKVIPPDSAILIFAVKNWFPNMYRDRPTEEQSGYEDDGLIKALRENVKELFLNGDDSEIISQITKEKDNI